MNSADPRGLAAGLLAAVAARAPAAGAAWLAEAARRKDGALGEFSTQAARRVGRAPLRLRADEAQRLSDAGLHWTTAAWTVADAARAALMLAASQRLSAPRLETLVEELYRFGDAHERVAVTRVLELLPQPARFLALGERVARSAGEPAFEALVCDNPYPARRFCDAAFEQLALKAAAAGFPPSRLIGLERRSAGRRWAEDGRRKLAHELR